MGCSQLPHSPELRARARQEWAPGPALDGGQPPSPSWHLEGGAALGWWGPREGRAAFPAVPGATHRLLTAKGPLGALPCATPAHARRSKPCRALAWPGSQQLWRLALWDRKDTLCPHVPRPTCALGLRSESKGAPACPALHPKASPSPLTLTMAGVQCDCPPPSVSSRLWDTDCVQTRGEAPGPAEGLLSWSAFYK